jgi:hypothetical protein
MRKTFLLLLALTPLATGEASAAKPTALETYNKGLSIYSRNDDVTGWDSALRELVKKKITPRNAANQLAPRYGITAEQMLALEELWFRSSALYDDIERERRPRTAIDADLAALDPAYSALIKEVHYTRFVVTVAVTATTIGDRCDPKTLTALMAGAPDPSALGWRAQQIAQCASWSLILAREFPPLRFAVLMDLPSWRRFSERLAIADFLLAGVNSHVALADQGYVRAYLTYSKLDAMFDAGLTRDALDTYRALPADLQRAVLSNTFKKHTITIDGLALRLTAFDDPEPIYVGSGPNNPQLFYASGDELALDLSAAEIVVESNQKAARALIPDRLRDVGSQALACSRAEVVSPGPPSRVCADRNSKQIPNLALLEMILNRPSDDPYVFLEQYLAGGMGSDLARQPVWIEAFCKRVEGWGYERQCSDRRGYDTTTEEDYLSGADAHDMTRAVLAAAAEPALDPTITGYQARIDAAKQARHAPPPASYRRTRKAAPPSPYTVATLPAAERTARKPDRGEDARMPKGLSPLPDGFYLVRAERDGATAVAVSLSQSLDPTGEVSAGGYWIHLSHDGGRSWEAPLYTGLAQLFPFVVMPSSKRQMLAGDTLTIEVSRLEIDTSSIIYPPVATRTLPATDNLYLTIPIAVLKQDSDGDGITDIVEKHVLLDPDRADSDGDGITDGEDSMPNVPLAPNTRSPRNEALALVLARVLGRPSGAIVVLPEQHDSSIEGQLSAVVRGRALGARSAPFLPAFVAGDPADFAGLRPDRPMLVYRESDLERLGANSPDFHTISITTTFNKAGDRGFAVWSAGWTGGTIGLVRDKGGWSLSDISNWIT